MWSFIFLSLNIIVLAIVIIIQTNAEDGTISFSQMTQVCGDKLWYLLGAVGMYGLWMLFKSFRIYLFILKSTKHSRPFLSYKTMALGKYYDNITPLSTGGQPFQIFYLKNRGIKASVATSIPFAKYIFSQLAFVLVCICVLIFSKKIAHNLDNLVWTMAVIGVVINFGLMAFMLLLSVSKKIGPAITILVLKILVKMKIVKDYEKSYDKVMFFVSEYQKTMRDIISNLPFAILSLLNSILIIAIQCGVPFFIICTFSSLPFSFELYGTVFILTILIEAIICYTPWPGAAGVAEITFATLFGHELVGLQSGTLLWAILIWRFFQYYGFLIQGIVVMIYDFLIGNKKIVKTMNRLKQIEETKSTNKNK